MNNSQVEAAAKAWLKAAGQDILHRIYSYRHQNPEVRLTDIQSMFGLNSCNMDDVLRGDLLGISASDLIKLFVASGLALDIKPIDEAIKEMKAQQMNGEMPHEFNRPREMRTQPNAQPRDRFGRFAPRHATEVANDERTSRHGDTNRRGVDNPYLSMPNEDLIRIIQMNLWDSEIDINSASHQDLVDFLMEKERAFAANESFNRNRRIRRQPSRESENANSERVINVEDATPREHTRNATRFSEPSVAGSRDNVSDFVKGITDFLENNPELSSQIAKILNR